MRRHASSISAPVCSKPRLRRIAERRRASASVAALSDDYYANFGHLPLTGDLSLGAAVRKWAASRAVEEDLCDA